MLSRFTVSNFKGFKEPLTFDLSETSQFEFNPECVRHGLVNKALIYGYNGVGKSNLGLAMFDVVMHLSDKMKKSDSYFYYQNAMSRNDLTDFTYDFVFNDVSVTYQYGKKDVDSLAYESCSIDGEEVLCYDRRKSTQASYKLDGTESLSTDLNIIKISLLRYVKANAVLVNNPVNQALLNMFDYIDRMLLFWSLDVRQYIGYDIVNDDMLDNIVKNGHFEDFRNFLKESNVESNITLFESNRAKAIMFDFDGNMLPFWKICSTGMKSLTSLYYWLQKLRFGETKPSLIFIDEFDAFYHQSLAEAVVNELKKNDCQVILTTHNTSLLSNDLMRPDCCFLMHKDRISPLSKLTDKELRFGHNIEKMYRAGLFGE